MRKRRENSRDNFRSLRGGGEKARGVWLAVHFPQHGAHIKSTVFGTESSRPALTRSHSHCHCVPLLPLFLLPHALLSPVLPGFSTGTPVLSCGYMALFHAQRWGLEALFKTTPHKWPGGSHLPSCCGSRCCLKNSHPPAHAQGKTRERLHSGQRCHSVE